MVGEQGVSVHIVEVAGVGVRASILQLVNFLGCFQAKQVIQPFLNGVIESITDWLIQSHLLKLSSCHSWVIIAILWSHSVLLS